jgi:hypothetical protein
MSERRGPTEHQEQSAVFAWARLREARWPELRLLFAVPNAAKRGVRLAAYMKAEGLRSGVPDMFLPVPRGGFTGLAIEQKIKGGEVSDNQEWWLEHLAAEGWKACVSWSAGETIELIEGYLRSRTAGE